MKTICSLWFATALLLAVAWHIGMWGETRAPELLAQPLESIDHRIENWVGSDNPPLSDRQDRSLNATSYLSRTYRRDSDELNLFIAYYANPRGGESMHSPKNCLPSSGWEVLQQDAITTPIDGGSVPINRYIVQRGADRNLVLYWYQSRSRIVASEYSAKYWLMRDSLTRGDVADSIVRIVLPYTGHALQDGLQFGTRVMSQLRRCFRT